MEKERKNIFFGEPGRPVGNTGGFRAASFLAATIQFADHVCSDPGRPVGDTESFKPAGLYALIVQFADHGCSDPRDKVIGLLGLVPDDAAHLADYSTPIEEYFKEVCKYAFTTASINDEWNYKSLPFLDTSFPRFYKHKVYISYLDEFWDNYEESTSNVRYCITCNCVEL